jgi:hypothetical protein
MDRWSVCEGLLFVLMCITFIFGCGKKEIVVRERSETPLISYETFEHGINPKSISLKVYSDGHVLKISEDDFSKKKELNATTISQSQVEELEEFFLHQGFLEAEPVSIPALYGGTVITITFTSNGKSNVIKFLDGTKIPYSVERCRDKIEDVLSSLF